METLEWALAEQKIVCQRLDLNGAGARAHLDIFARGRALLRMGQQSTRIVVGHRALLPVAKLLGREPTVLGIWVLCHGSELWNARRRPRQVIERRLLRRPNVHVVAVSSFTAGALAGECHATILPPGLSKLWFDSLLRASDNTRSHLPGICIVTAFRLTAWREKGLPQLIAAVVALDRRDIRLIICGSGDPPQELLKLIAQHSWCTLRAQVSDHELACELAAADLFVLATRTRYGRSASGEGFGLVLLEAQVAGTPVVVPAHGGSCDAYVEGVTGIAPTDESTEALARALDETLRDPIRLAWMRKRATEWARESFAPDRYAQLVARRLL